MVTIEKFKVDFVILYRNTMIRQQIVDIRVKNMIESTILRLNFLNEELLINDFMHIF